MEGRRFTDVVNLGCGAYPVSVVEAGLYVGAAAETRSTVSGLKKTSCACVCLWCRQREEVVKCEVTDVLGFL